MGQGIYVSQECHVINALPPVDLNGSAKNTDVWSMEGWGHASIIIQSGVSSSTVATFTITECDNFTPSNETAIAFAVYKEETADGDTLGAKVAATTSGVAMSTNNGIMYVAEVDARQLSDGFECMRVKFTDPSAAQPASVVVILSGGRYEHDTGDTAIA